MSDLKDLIERLEKAAGPDRELDHQIAKAVGWFEACGFTHRRYTESIPNYSASIDKALWLIPDEPKNELTGKYDWQLEQSNGGMTIWARVGPEETRSFAETPAIALCAAALKARL